MTKGNLQQDVALNFILGGNALFTMKSNLTQTRFTYKVLVDSRNSSMLRVSLLTGTDNTNDYKMVGTIEIVNHMPLFKPMSIHTNKAPAVVAFDFVLMNLCLRVQMPSLELWHEGRCCRCGRVLTVPESIENGIGPECIFKIVRVAL